MVNKDTSILIQFKIKIDKNNYRSISYLQTVKLNDLKDLTDVFTEFWNLRDEDYTSLTPTHIVFSYKYLNDTLKYGSLISSKFNRDKSLNNKKSINFKGFNLPNTMDFSK